jgi:hypothetical protein
VQTAGKQDAKLPERGFATRLPVTKSAHCSTERQSGDVELGIKDRLQRGLGQLQLVQSSWRRKVGVLLWREEEQRQGF